MTVQLNKAADMMSQLRHELRLISQVVLCSKLLHVWRIRACQNWSGVHQEHRGCKLSYFKFLFVEAYAVILIVSPWPPLLQMLTIAFAVLLQLVTAVQLALLSQMCHVVICPCWFNLHEPTHALHKCCSSDHLHWSLYLIAPLQIFSCSNFQGVCKISVWLLSCPKLRTLRWVVDGSRRGQQCSQIETFVVCIEA